MPSAAFVLDGCSRDAEFSTAGPPSWLGVGRWFSTILGVSVRGIEPTGPGGSRVRTKSAAPPAMTTRATCANRFPLAAKTTIPVNIATISPGSIADPELSLDEYESPEPGIPTVPRTPFRPKFNVDPGRPAEKLDRPCPVRLSRIPRARRNDLRYRKPNLCPAPVSSILRQSTAVNRHDRHIWRDQRGDPEVVATVSRTPGALTESQPRKRQSAKKRFRAVRNGSGP